MAPHHAARLRFLALCVAVVCQSAVLAMVARLGLTQLLNGRPEAYDPGTLAAWLGLAAVPGFLLTPVIGPAAGGRANRMVLIGGPIVVLALLVWAMRDPNFPLTSLGGFLALEAVVFGTAALTLLPAFARETGWKSVPVCVLFALAGGAGMMALFVSGGQDLSYALATAVVGLLAVVAVRVDAPGSGASKTGLIRGFLTGAKDAFRLRQARSALLGLWVWGFVVLAVLFAGLRLRSAAELDLYSGVIDAPGPVVLPEYRFSFEGSGRTVVTALLAGVLVSFLNRNAFRHGGFILMGATLLAASCVWLVLGGSWDVGRYPLGFALGLSLSPLLHVYLTWTDPKHHRVAASLVFGGWCAGAVILAAVLVGLGPDPLAARQPLLTVLAIATGLAALGAWLTLFRPAMELTAEIFFSLAYRVTSTGPGASAMPARGPYLVIGNHSAWLDPLFLAKVLPAPIMPMMTSKFYDLPVISFLMRRVVGTIRVPDVSYRHEAPELQEAVKALDHGEALIVFPEGFLRRKEEVPLKRFGRGVWQILRDRPDTEIYACWIEGNWGSFTSFKGGPPMKNKRFDFWRPIRIGVRGPFRLDPATLADHMTTRRALMDEVAKAREPLGLEPLTTPAVGPEGDEG